MQPIKAGNEKSSDSPTVGPMDVYQGHEDTVENVQFCPGTPVSADTSVSMFDHHNLTSGGVGLPIYKFEGHKAAVLCMNLVWKLFNNFYKNWALKSVAAPNPSLEFIYIIFRLGCKKKEHAGTRVPNSPPGLFFLHSGHRYMS
ncbi:hypothetical protein BHE74_00047718 [Ensete ventricosum]|nr:hypothetical protein BHE74_00047718 [Ensete ventricosum]